MTYITSLDNRRTYDSNEFNFNNIKLGEGVITSTTMADNKSVNTYNDMLKIKLGLLQNINTEQLKKFLFDLVIHSKCVDFDDINNLNQFNIINPTLDLVLNLDKCEEIYKLNCKCTNNLHSGLDNREKIIKGEIVEPFTEMLAKIMDRIQLNKKYIYENDTYRYKDWIAKILEGRDISFIRKTTLDILSTLDDEEIDEDGLTLEQRVQNFNEYENGYNISKPQFDDKKDTMFRYYISSVSSILFPKRDNPSDYDKDTIVTVTFLI